MDDAPPSRRKKSSTTPVAPELAFAKLTVEHTNAQNAALKAVEGLHRMTVKSIDEAHTELETAKRAFEEEKSLEEGRLKEMREKLTKDREEFVREVAEYEESLKNEAAEETDHEDVQSEGDHDESEDGRVRPKLENTGDEDQGHDDPRELAERRQLEAQRQRELKQLEFESVARELERKRAEIAQFERNHGMRGHLHGGREGNHFRHHPQPNGYGHGHVDRHSRDYRGDYNHGQNNHHDNRGHHQDRFPQSRPHARPHERDRFQGRPYDRDRGIDQIQRDLHREMRVQQERQGRDQAGWRGGEHGKVDHHTRVHDRRERAPERDMDVDDAREEHVRERDRRERDVDADDAEERVRERDRREREEERAALDLARAASPEHVTVPRPQPTPGRRIQSKVVKPQRSPITPEDGPEHVSPRSGGPNESAAPEEGAKRAASRSRSREQLQRTQKQTKSVLERLRPGEHVNSRTIKVNNLHKSVTVPDLERIFNSTGEVETAVVMVFPDTLGSRGFGFVKFYAQEDADRALDEKQGLVLHGRAIHIVTAYEWKRDEDRGAADDTFREVREVVVARGRKRSRSRNRVF